MSDMEIDLGRLLDTLPGLAWSALPDGRAEYVGKQWLDYTGMTFEHSVGAGWIEAVHPDDRPRLLSAWGDIIASGRLGEVEARFRRHDGVYRWFLFRASPMPDRSGEVNRWCGMNFDIDDRIRAETELLYHRGRLERIFEGLPVISGLFSPEGTIISSNRLMLDFLGMTLEEIQAKPSAFDHHPDDHEETMEAWWAAVRDGQPYQHVARLRRKDGAYLWHRLLVAPLRNSAGEIEVLYGVASNIDAQWRAEALLAAEKQLLERVAKGVALPVVLDELARAVEALEPGFYCTILTVDESGRRFNLGAAPTLPEGYKAILDGKDIDPNYGPLSRCIFEKAPIIVGDAANDPRWAGSVWPARMQAHGLRSSWTAPILAADGAALGAFAIYRREPEIPTPQEQELIDRFTHIAGIAIERAQGDAALKASEAVLAGEKQLLELVAMGAALPDALTAISSQVEALVPGSICSVLVVDAQNRQLHAGASPRLPAGFSAAWEGLPIDPKRGPASLAVTLKAPVVSADLANDPRWPGSPWLALTIENGFWACWSLPILSAHGDALGAFMVYRTSPGQPRPKDLELVDRFAKIAGIAIERTQAVAALKASEAEVKRTLKYMTLAQQLSQTGSYDQDVATDEQNLSEEMYRIWEFDSRKPVTQDMVFGRVHPDDLATAMEMQAAMAAGDDFELAYRIATPNGAVKHLRTFSQRQTDIADRVVYVGATQDVTDWKLAEEGLRASQAELLQAYAHLNEAQQLSRTGSFTWDVERDEHNWSAEERRMWEFEPDVKITMPMILAAVHPDDLPLAEQVIGGAVEESSFELVLRIITKSGALKHLHIVGRRVDDSHDHPVFLGAIQDITERKNAEEALNRARAELSHMSRAMTLSALTASIAHEVNQPLAGIITNANTGLRLLAVDPPNLDGVRATLQRTLRDGNRASEVIKRLRAMFARKSSSLEPVDLKDAASEVLAMSAGDLQQRRVVLDTDFAADLPAIVGDRVQLQQVILNLVLNATDAMSDVEDRPHSLRIATVRDGANGVRFSVQDSGVGIEPDKAEQLFHAFYTTKSHGMGIGLAISRTIIENHDGRLWAAPNDDGPGATFSFSIPNQPVLVEQPEVQPHPEESALVE